MAGLQAFLPSFLFACGKRPQADKRLSHLPFSEICNPVLNKPIEKVFSLKTGGFARPVVDCGGVDDDWEEHGRNLEQLVESLFEEPGGPLVDELPVGVDPHPCDLRTLRRVPDVVDGDL